MNGAVIASPITNNSYIRFGSGQGVIFTNTSNNWEGPTQLGEGSGYFYSNTLLANTSLLMGGSNPADFGTSGSFTRALGSAAGQIYFGRSNDGQRALGFSVRSGALTVNLGGSAADFPFLNTYARTGATDATSAVTLTDATHIIAGTTTFGSGSIFEWELDTVQSNPETNRGIA